MQQTMNSGDVHQVLQGIEKFVSDIRAVNRQTVTVLQSSVAALKTRGQANGTPLLYLARPPQKSATSATSAFVTLVIIGP